MSDFVYILFLSIVLLHLLPQAQRAHIRPHFFDIAQAFCFAALLASIVPAKGVFPVGGPDAVLFFVVYDYFVDGAVVFHGGVGFVVNQKVYLSSVDPLPLKGSLFEVGIIVCFSIDYALVAINSPLGVGGRQAMNTNFDYLPNPSALTAITRATLPSCSITTQYIPTAQVAVSILICSPALGESVCCKRPNASKT